MMRSSSTVTRLFPSQSPTQVGAGVGVGTVAVGVKTGDAVSCCRVLRGRRGTGLRRGVVALWVVGVGTGGGRRCVGGRASWSHARGGHHDYHSTISNAQLADGGCTAARRHARCRHTGLVGSEPVADGHERRGWRPFAIGPRRQHVQRYGPARCRPDLQVDGEQPPAGKRRNLEWRSTPAQASVEVRRSRG